MSTQRVDHSLLDTEPLPPAAKPVHFWHALLPVAVLVVFIIWGMIVGPLAFDLPSWPLEFTFVLAALSTWLLLFHLGFRFDAIATAMARRTRTALPAIWMLMAIGILIGSWTAAGTIPMLVHYGMLIIDPAWIYIVALLLTSLFSVLTGTSWGSVGTIGVVLINIGMATDANLGLLAAAIISGGYFGDKMSPLSDTTNMAAMGAGVPLYSHVRSMVNTTGPAYLVALVLTAVFGVFQPARGEGVDVSAFTRPVADDLASAFDFTLLVWVPLLVMLIGAFLRKPPLPTLLYSAASGALVALITQGFSLDNVIRSLINGVSIDMTGAEVGEQAVSIIERGGLYSMASAVLITLCVFMYIGSLDLINAMGTVVDKAFGRITSRPGIIISSLVSSAFINSFSSNQYATSFIIGTAFGPKYDEAGIPRKVLSRSIEDYGTFIEPMLPWTTTGVYMVATLGVAYAAYVPYMFLQWVNFIIAPLLAITGIGCFYGEAAKRMPSEAESLPEAP
ncbi:Na+/H+ antiporter NhaC family protein [Actinomyces mediterranea]|uniref:Na+/H+ antiporter NhaC family protein n=1 Tax=Actinomyces mediterranea TaxID=1871028 RepID=UPI000970A6A5|nr:Na+/H+ antiporter NhaC family protein [Actinomyces mediterranea]